MRHFGLACSVWLGSSLRSLSLSALAFGLATQAVAQSPTKVRYEEAVRSVLYVPMYVALNQGYFKENGLSVSMKTSQGTDKGMAALLSNSADIVLIGPEATVYVANSESPVKPKIFCALTATDGFLLLSRKPIDKFNWSMLKGKSVMSFRPGSNPDVCRPRANRVSDAVGESRRERLGSRSRRMPLPPSGSGRPVSCSHHSPRSTTFAKPSRA